MGLTMIGRASALAMAIVLVGCAQQLGASSLTGVYSNVRYSDETGDAGGFEVQLNADTTNPTIVFTICEGGCYGGETWPVEVVGNRIAFQVTHEWARSDGGPPLRETEQYEGTIDGQVLSLRSPQVPGVDPRLVRVPHPRPNQTARLAGKKD